MLFYTRLTGITHVILVQKDLTLERKDDIMRLTFEQLEREAEKRGYIFERENGPDRTKYTVNFNNGSEELCRTLEEAWSAIYHGE